MSPVMFRGGKVLFRSGKPAMSPGCCCCPAGTPCEHCDDTTPLKFTVVVSGIVVCPCTNDGNNSADGTCTIDATFCLTQNGACQWINNDVGAITINFYAGVTDCSGAPDTYADVQVGAVLTRTAGQFRLQIFTGDIGDGIGSDGFAFDSGLVNVEKCADQFVLNDDGTCELSFDGRQFLFKLCRNGTATITCGC